MCSFSFYVSHSPPHGLAWLSAPGQTYAIYGKHITLNRYSTWNRKTTSFFYALYRRYGSTSGIILFGYIGINLPKELRNEVWQINPATTCMFR
jgi:hypothetical protein